MVGNGAKRIVINTVATGGTAYGTEDPLAVGAVIHRTAGVGADIVKSGTGTVRPASLDAHCVLTDI